MTLELLSDRAFGTLQSASGQGPAFGAEIAALADGRVALAWTENDPTGDLMFADDAVWTRLADASGASLTDPIRAASDPTGIHGLPVVAPLGDGYAVAWTRSAPDVAFNFQRETMLRLFDGEGQLRGPQIVVSPPLSEGGASSLDRAILALETGGALVGYTDLDADQAFARPLAADGTLGDPVAVIGEGNLFPEWAELATGDVVLATRNAFATGAEIAIYGPDLTSGPGGTGAPVVFGWDAGAPGALVLFRDVAPLSDGGFAIAYTVRPTEGPGALRVTRFDGQGAEGTTIDIPVGGEPEGLANDAWLVDAGDGVLAIAYEPRAGADQIDTVVRLIAPDDTLSDPVRAHTAAANNQEVDGATLVNGDLLLAITGRGGEPDLPGGPDELSLVRLDLDADGPPPPPPPPADLRVEGTPGPDRLEGAVGDDLLIGFGGTDRMTGGAGADTFVLFAGPDGPPRVLVTDWEPGADRLAIDDRLLGLGGAEIAPRALDGAMALALLASGRVSYDPAESRLLIDGDGDGRFDSGVDLGSDVRIGLEYVLIF